MGRFTQEDTYRGDGLNLYAYCRNNPVYYADPSGHMSKCMRDALQRVMERDGVTQEQMDSDPDRRFRLMADASNIVKEQKRQQREQGNNSPENEIPALPGPGPTLALPGPVVDTSDNRLSNTETDGPDNNSRQSGGNTTNVFPDNPDNLFPEIPRDKVTKTNGTTSQIIYLSDHVRIRAEQHPLLPGETYNPRHHGVHYHVECRNDTSRSWNNNNNVNKVHPNGYTPGAGTGFLPGETFPE